MLIGASKAPMPYLANRALSGLSELYTQGKEYQGSRMKTLYEKAGHGYVRNCYCIPRPWPQKTKSTRVRRNEFPLSHLNQLGFPKLFA